ncbi:hypothetical protein [Flavobacterium frigidarium]|uniref:Uncharacterized protein n=1 Tax=Flavobacterium frigidarium TaxID=99286 RepID=A0ABV4KEL8_9FLAO
MKTIISISMSILFLFQGIRSDMDLCDTIQEISKFITHYQDHKVYGDSFFEYVVEDYINKNESNTGHHNNPNKDNLPIHCNHQCCYSNVLFIADIHADLIDQLKFVEEKQFNRHIDNFCSTYLQSSFEPPKI